MKKIILASASPRRCQLLKLITNSFITIPSNIKESYPSNINPLLVPLYISNLKASDVYKNHLNDIVIGADTAIIFNDLVIGKPIDKNDARKTLLTLSNKMHYVVTGVTVYCNNQKYEINSINEVYFKKLSIKEIDEYLEDDEYIDKAGSYAIQGKGKKFIDKIIGDYNSIVGLPIDELNKLLKKINE